MENSKLNFELISALEKIYQYESVFNAFFQSETKILKFIDNHKQNDLNSFLLPSDISKALNMTSPRVSAILSNLEKKGYIKRDFSTVDRRKVYIYITDEGKTYLNNIYIDTNNLINSAIEKLGQHDTYELIRIINQLVE